MYICDVDKVRVDKWLWAARCFKHRNEATQACQGGHVKVNGDVAKAARMVVVGDEVDARTPGGRRVLEVAGLAEKRGPAAVAQTLYVDHTPELPKDMTTFERRERGLGRPTKRERRRMDDKRRW